MPRKPRPYYEIIAARNLSRVIRDSGQPQRKFAEHIGMSTTELSDKLHGRTTCLDLLEPASKYYGVSPMSFFIESAEQFKTPEEHKMLQMLREKGITEAKVLQYALSGDLYRLEEAIGREALVELAKLLTRKNPHHSLKK